VNRECKQFPGGTITTVNKEAYKRTRDYNLLSLDFAERCTYPVFQDPRGAGYYIAAKNTTRGVPEVQTIH
jgi:hypothetical protein